MLFPASFPYTLETFTAASQKLGFLPTTSKKNMPLNYTWFTTEFPL